MERLSKGQRERLERFKNELEFIQSSIWGLLSPSAERDEARFHITKAANAVYRMLKEPEQMTLEDFENAGTE